MVGPSVLSVDVEDYFHVEAFTGNVSRADWDAFPCRVETNTRRILDILDERSVSGTFFILGWVADRYPGLVRDIADRGHELACHSYWHRLIYSLKPEEFREDTLRAKDCIEQTGGVAVRGYRAPSFSISSQSLWALEILAEAGFTYDSSIFPIRHGTYGIPHAPRAPFKIETPSGPLVEYPISTFRLSGQNMPVGGGGYLRIFPTWYTRFGVDRLRQEAQPLIVYLHPWEIDPKQPRIAAGLKSRIRHYTNLKRMESKIRMILTLGAPFTTFHRAGLDQTAEFYELRQATFA